MYKDIGQRIKQLREYFDLSQEELAYIIGYKQSNISRIEAGKIEPIPTAVHAIIARFPVNPEWLQSGEGEMLISPENYLINGIKLLGREKLALGIVNLLKSGDYRDLKTLVSLDDLAESGLPETLAPYLRYIVQTWQHGDEKTRNWLERQLELAFQGVKREEKRNN